MAKASAIADVYTSVTVYFAPYGDSGVQTDGVTPSTVFTNTIPVLTKYLTGKVPANTTVTFQPPSYVLVNVVASITVLPQFRTSLVTTAVTDALNQLFAFDNVSFQDKITLNDVMSTITAVDGVAYVQVSKLARNDSDLTYTVTNKAASGTVATLTVGTHALAVGDTVQVAGVDSTFNGTFVVTAVASTTFSYALVSAVITTTAATGTSTKLTVRDVVCGVNEIPQLNTTSPFPSLTFTGGISN